MSMRPAYFVFSGIFNRFSLLRPKKLNNAKISIEKYRKEYRKNIEQKSTGYASNYNFLM